MIGFDVSKWNSGVPWGEAQFALVRVSHGLGSDPMAEQHLTNARTAGIDLLGGYHYLRGDSAGVYQAGYFWDRVRELGGEESMALAVDLEHLPPPSSPWDRSVYRRCVLEFLSRVRQLAGRPCAVYSYRSLLQWLAFTSEEVGDAHLWISDVNGEVEVPIPWRDWTIHQYTYGGGKLDRDRFRGSVGDWCRAFGVALLSHPAGLVAGAVERAAGGTPGRYYTTDEGPTIDMGEGDG